MTNEELRAEYQTLIVTAAHILLRAENAVTAAHDGKTPNEIAGTILDVPAQLKQVSTLIETVLILNQRAASGGRV